MMGRAINHLKEKIELNFARWIDASVHWLLYLTTSSDCNLVICTDQHPVLLIHVNRFLLRASFCLPLSEFWWLYGWCISECKYNVLSFFTFNDFPQTRMHEQATCIFWNRNFSFPCIWYVYNAGCGVEGRGDLSFLCV